jgi:hypothetical protein
MLEINILSGYSNNLNKYVILLPFSFCFISVTVNLIYCSGKDSNLTVYFSNILVFNGISSLIGVSFMFLGFFSFIIGCCVSGASVSGVCGSGVCGSGCGSCSVIIGSISLSSSLLCPVNVSISGIIIFMDVCFCSGSPVWSY